MDKLFLQKRLYLLRMNDGDSITKHLNAFNSVINQWLSVNIKITKEEKRISIFCSLLDSWDNLVMVVGRNNTTLKIDDVVVALFSEEMRRKTME